MNAASAAAMSDPRRNPSFRRRWQEQLDRSASSRAPTPRPEVALEMTGRALLEQWRREQTKREGMLP